MRDHSQPFMMKCRDVYFRPCSKPFFRLFAEIFVSFLMIIYPGFDFIFGTDFRCFQLSSALVALLFWPMISTFDDLIFASSFFTKFFYHHAFMLEREESQETLLKSDTYQQTPVSFPGWMPFLKFVRLDRTWYAMPSQSQQMAFIFRLFSLSAHLILLCTWLVFLFQKQKGRFTSSFEVLIFIFLLVNYKSMGGSRRFALVPLRFASRCAAVQLVSDSSGFPFWW